MYTTFIQIYSASGILPKFAKEGDSGMDVQYWEPNQTLQGHEHDCTVDIEPFIVIPPNERRLIPTGLFVAIPKGYEMQVRSRSGLALKRGVFVLNSPGTIDSGYRGEIKIILQNMGKDPFAVRIGDRVAQLVVAKVVGEGSLGVKVMVDELDLGQTSRDTGGFGSTGVSSDSGSVVAE
jgi:dUTP pyrophosphatase